MIGHESLWLIIGFVGQGLFAARFLMQWLASEREGRSVIPVIFWYFSLAGGTVLFIYALHREDPVFILGQSLGLIIYGRNLYLISRERRQTEEQQVALEGSS